ncbi:hypothetical protein [Streptomyces sp. RerS4]|uniref:hypothetical protein n=1 Tax=Streptomyces sp. RerS4 TaxID=2942449 RepID=UPI00201C3319|nr:hypothetical protein [Streptomyces sp. RerS4]UQX04476.1 hypothetical protein M4D82_31190 [Streptomyces sp. RerS4]
MDDERGSRPERGGRYTPGGRTAPPGRPTGATDGWGRRRRTPRLRQPPEYRHGLVPLGAGETQAGADRFALGAGRHGTFGE